MNIPVAPEDVKLAHGHSGKGVQLVCPCGCIDMRYLEAQEPTWSCRNCGLVFTYDFLHLVEKLRALEKQEQPAGAPTGGAPG